MSSYQFVNYLTHCISTHSVGALLSYCDQAMDAFSNRDSYKTRNSSILCNIFLHIICVKNLNALYFKRDSVVEKERNR